MLQSVNGHSHISEEYSEQAFGETPFVDPRAQEQEDSQRESAAGEAFTENWEFTTPFAPGESTETGFEVVGPEAREFSEIVSELKDTLFRESLEQLADEALEAHADQLAGEYGDHEMRDLTSERVLTEHFEPLAVQAEAMLDRFFERVEGYEAESLTDMELDRIAGEVLSTESSFSPASEQFLGGLLRKATKLVSGAVKLARKIPGVSGALDLAQKGISGAINLAGKGLAAVGKLALRGLLEPLKALGRYLLNHVVKFALGQLPPALRPIGQQLADRLFRAIGETHEGEIEGHEQTEAEAMPALVDAAQLEAEFDIHAAQLLFLPEQGEVEHLVSSYGEGEASSLLLGKLDAARSQFVKQLSELQPGENTQPIMEQFIPAALWPAAKTAITILGRPKLISFLGDLLSKLIKPLIGSDASALLAPAIADAGLKLFGLETAAPHPRALLGDALAATVEETLNSVGELPPHVLENELLLSDAVHEAFENAAAAYFPNSTIKPELRESVERHGMWTRMPARSARKRYAKYSDTLPVEISPRVAGAVGTFGGATIADHLRDQHGLEPGRPFKGQVSLYQALPGARGSTIARAEGFPPSQLHPLTPQAAAVLLGPNASLGRRQTPGRYLATAQRLHVNQRLYRIHPPAGRRHHAHPVRAELLINLLRGEIRIWLYISEQLCQRIAADLAKGNNATGAFRRLKPLVMRTAEALKMAIVHRHLPPEILVVGEVPNLDGKVPHWLRHAGHHFGTKIGEWAQAELARYLQNNAQEFIKTCASRHDGVTLRITMTRIPGIDVLRQMSEGKNPKEFAVSGWPKGSPAFQVIARPGFSINRLRD